MEKLISQTESLGEEYKDHIIKQNKIFPLFCIKSNNKTKEFMDKYIINLMKIKDDQKAINLELIDTKWNYKNYNILPNKKYIYFSKMN